jgi:hypothetical protein
MNLTTLNFGRHLYRLGSIPEPHWYQRSPDDATECSRCGQTLSFCFAGRVDKSKAGSATDSIIPLYVRCDCFLADRESTTSSCHQRLARPPIPITPEKKLDAQKENKDEDKTLQS